MDDVALLHSLLDHLPDAVCFKDAEGRFLRINRVLAAWYGIAEPQDAVGKTEAELQVHGLVAAETEREILKSGVPRLDQEILLVGRDGKSRSVSLCRCGIGK